MPETPASSTPMAAGEKPEKTPPSFPADLETLLELTTNAAARSVDYLLVHEQSFKLIEHLTEFHTAISQAREQLRQVTRHTSIKAQVAETQEQKSMESTESTENTESTEGSTEGAEGMESTESAEGAEGITFDEEFDLAPRPRQPEGASAVGGDASSVQLSDTALQLFLDKKEEVAPLSGMWSQLFDITKEQKRGVNGTAGALMEFGQQENCDVCVIDTPEAKNKRDDKLREENGKDSTVYSSEGPLATLVRLMDRLAPVIVEIG